MSRIEQALRRASQGALDDGPSEPEIVNHAPLSLAHGGLPDVQMYASERELPGHPVWPTPERNAEEDRVEPVAPASLNAAANEKLVVSPAARPDIVEQYRRLAATLYQVDTGRPSRIVMISSATAGEGKSLTASNLALTLSESFRRSVLLIDGDLRRPTIHQVFKMPNRSGLNEVLQAAGEEKLSLIRMSPYLTVLPAGRPNPDPMGGLTSPRMRQVIDEAAANFEWVVIDTPPVGLLSDANLLAAMVDMIVLVIGAGTTPYALIERAVASLNRGRIVGVVLNRVRHEHADHHYYRYYGEANAGS